MKYAIAIEGEHTLEFFYRNLEGFIVLTRIVPQIFPNKKKANRMLRRLNKHHGGDWFVINYGELTRR